MENAILCYDCHNLDMKVYSQMSISSIWALWCDTL